VNRNTKPLNRGLAFEERFPRVTCDYAVDFDLKLFISSFFVAFVLGNASGMAAPVLSVDPIVGLPGTTVHVAVSYVTDTNAPSLQFDLLYSTNYLASGTPTGGDALSDHQVASSEPAPGVRRVLIFSFSNTPITNGVLVFVPFTIATNSSDHDEPLSLSNVVVSSPQAEPVPAYASNNVMVIAIPPRIISVVKTNSSTIVELAGTDGRGYRLEAQTNPSDTQWISLVTNIAVNGIAEFEDTNAASFPFRFYRAALAR
jgi:hypothetical protein